MKEETRLVVEIRRLCTQRKLCIRNIIQHKIWHIDIPNTNKNYINWKYRIKAIFSLVFKLLTLNGIEIIYALRLNTD